MRGERGRALWLAAGVAQGGVRGSGCGALGWEGM